MAHRILWIVLVLVVLGLACLAQDSEPIPAPDDLSLTVHAEGERHQFHLGEPIAVEYAYTAPPGRYLYVSRLDRLSEGRPLRVECIPALQSASDASVVSRAEGARFQQILIDPSCQGFDGGGVGGGCGDCDQEYPLSSTPLGFGVGHLNRYVRFTEPGTYSCRVTSAQVTTAARDEKIRPALLVKSNWLKITITDDPAWTHSAALTYAAAYEKNCRGDGVPNRTFSECSDISARLTYLDSAESVAIVVRFFDGRNHGWESGFWDAITTTSHPNEALRLMARRLQDSEVQVSDSLLRWLAMSALKADHSGALEPTTTASVYHAEAMEQLRKYVRLVGNSLPAKNSDVLQESAKTYQTFAEQRSCNGDPLIPDAERTAVLETVQSRTVPDDTTTQGLSIRNE